MTFSSTHLPKPPDAWAYAALAFSAVCVLAAYAATTLVRNAVAGLGQTSGFHEIIFGIVIAAALSLFWPASRALLLAQQARAARARADAVETRIASAASRDKTALTFGWGVFALLVLAFFVFIFMNNSAVGKTFFLLPLIYDKWFQVFTKFVTVNIFVFVIAEIIVLIWGLVVALARMIPGPAGQPIRFLATLYCDVFRGMPAIVTLYLILVIK